MNSQILPRIRESLFQTGTARVITALRGAVIGVLIARHLGPENFGIYNFAFALVTIASVTVPMGADQLLLKYLTADDSDEKKLIFTGMKIRSCGLVISFLVLGTFLYLRPQSWEILFIIIVFCISEAAQVLMVRRLGLEASHRFKDLAKAEIIAVIAGAVVALLGITFDWPMWSFALAILVQAWVYALMLWRVPRRQKTQASPHVPKLNYLMKQSFPYLVASGAAVVYTKIDVVMIEQIRGLKEAGLYATSVRACDVGILGPLAFMYVVTPRLYSATPEELKERFRQAAVWMFRISVATIAGGLLFGLPLFPIVYSEAFKDAAPVFACLLPSIMLVGTGLLTSTLVVRSSKGATYMVGNCIAAGLNIGLNFALIPTLGMYGAVIATLVSYLLAVLFTITVVRETRWALVTLIKSLRLF